MDATQYCADFGVGAGLLSNCCIRLPPRQKILKTSFPNVDNVIFWSLMKPLISICCVVAILDSPNVLIAEDEKIICEVTKDNQTIIEEK